MAVDGLDMPRELTRIVKAGKIAYFTALEKNSQVKPGTTSR